jgi:sugar lactone lactonase YvrE
MHPVHCGSSGRAALAARFAKALAARLRATAALALAFSLLAFGGAARADELRSVKGLATPESVVVGADGRIYVSEIGGFGKDGDGRIVVLDAAGTAVKPFATGLDDPKGLVAVGKLLYVADKTRVMKIDASGRVTVLAEAKDFSQPPLFLNDLAVDARGDLYVSDTGDTEKGSKGAIYRITPQGEVSLLVSEAQNPLFRNPNGLLFEPSGSLLVVDFFSGDLLRLDMASKKAEKLAGGFGGGDGLALDAAGMLYLTDWKGGRAWKLDLNKPGAKPQQYDRDFQAAADITLSSDGKFVLLPDMKAGTLYWLPK